MLQSMTGSMICRECNASYESETKRRDHQRMSHRGGGAEREPQTAKDEVQSEDPQV